MPFDKQAFVMRWLNELRAEQSTVQAQRLVHEANVESDELKMERLEVQIEVAEEYLQNLP